MVCRHEFVEQATTLQKVQQRLGLRRTALGSLGEAATVFDPEVLRPILAELAGRAVKMVRSGFADLVIWGLDGP